MSVISPCYGCVQRTLTCHDKCEQYIAWKSSLEKAENRIAEDFLYDAVTKTLRRNHRRSKCKIHE